MALNPKQLYRQSNGSNSKVFGTTIDPISEEIRDPRQEAFTLHTYNVVPFMNKGEVTLDLLHKLTELSPTNGSIIQRKHRYTLGGQWDVTKKKPSGWAMDDLAEPTSPEKESFRDWIEYRLGDIGTVSNIASPLLQNYLRYGNGYVELKIVTVANESFAFLYHHDFDRGLYASPEVTEDKTLMLSPFWYSPSNYGKEPVAIPLYPNFKENNDGSLSTMFHLKNKVPRRDWYGMSDWIECLYFAYNEIQVGEYNVFGFGNDWTPRIYMETFDGYGDEQPANNPDYDLNGEPLTHQDSFRNNVDTFLTNSGSARRRYLHRANTLEGKETFIHEFSPSLEWQHYKESAATAERQIIKAHDWHTALMVETPGKLGGGQVFQDAFRAKYYTVIQPLEEKVTDFLNEILEVVDAFTGDGITQELSLGLINLHSEMLKDTAQAEKEGTQQTTPQDAD